MATSAPPVDGRPARFAFIQLASAGDGTDKAANLEHAREKLAEAVKGGPEGRKPDLVVLPVRRGSPGPSPPLSR